MAKQKEGKKIKVAKAAFWFKGDLIVYLPYSVIQVPKKMIKRIL